MAKDTKERILEAALEMFSQKGYEGTNIRELAASLGGREVTEFQIMAWTLPCAAGFYYMRDLAHTNPFEVGLEGGFAWDKEFIGKEALLKVREEGPAREVVGFTVAEADIHIKGRHMGNEGEKVFVDGEEVGRVMKIVYSYVNEITIIPRNVNAVIGGLAGVVTGGTFSYCYSYEDFNVFYGTSTAATYTQCYLVDGSQANITSIGSSNFSTLTTNLNGSGNSDYSTWVQPTASSAPVLAPYQE